MYIKEMPSPSNFNIRPSVLYDLAIKIQAPILRIKTRAIIISVIFLTSLSVFFVYIIVLKVNFVKSILFTLLTFYVDITL